MNVSLTRQHEAFIRAKVKSGRYLSASEVVREALRLLADEDRRKMSRLQQEIALGLEQIDRGEYMEFDEAGLRKYFDGVTASVKRRAAKLPKKRSRA